MTSRRAWLGMAFGGVVAGRLVAQDSAQAGDADALRWPEAVQRREVVREGDDDATVKAIERRLKCTCGCNLDIFTCRTTDFTCTTSPAMHRQVMELHQAGRSPQEIVDAFVDEYGVQVLMAPPPQGFNLAGYLVPGLAIAAAGLVLAALLMRRQQVAASDPVAASAQSDEGTHAAASPEELERLRRVLSDVAD